MDLQRTSEDYSDWFWNIIASANKDYQNLIRLLEALSNSDLYRFALEFRSASDWLRDRPYVDALEYGSDDNIADMSYWVVSRGKEYYQHIIDHPEAVAEYDSAGSETLGFEGVAEDILRQRIDEDLWDDLDDDLYDVYRHYIDSGYRRVADYWLEQEQERR